MRFNKAQSLIQIDVSKLTEEQLQKYKVTLLDAWRYAKGDYGYNNDFFIYTGELKAYTPRDFWLLKNIEDRLNLLEL